MKKLLVLLGVFLTSVAPAFAADVGFRSYQEALGILSPTLASDDEVWCRDVSATGSAQSKACTMAQIADLAVARDAELAALSGLTSAANQIPYWTGSGTAAQFAATTYGRSLLNVADEAAFKALINAEAGVDFQAYSAALTAIGGLTATDNNVIIGNGTAFVTESGSTLRTSLGLSIGSDVQAFDAQLTDVAGVTPADNVVIVGNGTNFVGESDTTLRTSLGLAIGSDVQAYDSDTAAYAINGTNGIWARTGTGTGAARTLTGTTNKITVTNGDGVSGNPTFNVGSDVYVVGGTDVALADGGTGASLTDPNVDRIMFWDDSAGATTWLEPEGVLSVNGTKLRAIIPLMQFAISDETTSMTTGDVKIALRSPCAATITAIRGSLSTASSSGTPTWDINEEGATILSTKLTIDASEKTSVTAATPAVISDTSIADDAEITVDVDTAGTGAKGGKITIMGYCQ